MATEAKIKEVGELRDRFQRARGAVLADFRGMSVAQMTDLRNRLRQEGVELRVVKNSLAKRAATHTPFEKLHDQFEGPVSIAFGYDDPTTPAKLLVSFAKVAGLPRLTAGLIEGKAVDGAGVRTLATLPPRAQLLSHLMGTLNQPTQNLLGALQGAVRQFVGVLYAISEKRGAASADVGPSAQP